MAWNDFLRQYAAQGREKADGYDASHFAELDEGERAKARSLLLERGLAGDTTDLDGLRHVGDASTIAALQAALARDTAQEAAFAIGCRETLFHLTDDPRQLEPLFRLVDGRGAEEARRAAEALARHPLPARFAGPLAQRLIGGRHEQIRAPLLQAWLAAREDGPPTPAMLQRHLPFVRRVLARAPRRRAPLLAVGPDLTAPAGTRDRFRRPARILVPVLLAVAAAAAGHRYLHTMPVGTGERQASPDGRLTASVTDWSARGFFTGAHRRWFQYRVEGPGVLHELTGEPVEGPHFGSRSSHRVIRWSPDSRAVEFVFPATVLRLEMHRPPGPPS